MTKRVTMSVAAFVLFASAFGVGTKIRSFAPAGEYGSLENLDCDGMAMLTYDANHSETTIQVVLNGFLPDTTYGLKLESDGGGFVDPIAVDTNPAGNGVFHLTIPQNRTGHPKITVFLWDGDGSVAGMDTVTDAEARAVGFAS